VLLLDLRLPGIGGLEVLERLGASLAAPPATLVLTTFETADLVLGAMKAGARGYLRKDVTLSALVNAIETLHAGGTFIQPALSARLLEGLRRHPAAFPASELPEPLTQRERQVLRLMAGGLSNREIAQALRAAEGTIKHHVSSILSKLGVSDRTRAVLKAFETGMV
jgi:DNA-binding NarL/FixJ family response regulator